MYIMTLRGRRRRGGQIEEEFEEEMYDETPETTSTPSPIMGGRRRRGRSRRRRGGQSATSYAMNTAGSGDTQWNNVFNNAKTMTASTGAGLWSADLTQNVAGVRPIDPSLGKLMQGGKRRRSKRRGGNLMGVVGQAVVPFGLLGLQQAYSKRKGRRGGRKSRRRVRGMGL